MPSVVIENPILNSPFVEPSRHFRFGEEGITSEIVPKRRSSSYLVPIPLRTAEGVTIVVRSSADEQLWYSEELRPSRISRSGLPVRTWNADTR